MFSLSLKSINISPGEDLKNNKGAGICREVRKSEFGRNSGREAEMMLEGV